ncbi:hypothetical protein HK104_010515, partial [Borealophlyctis nickersoniae]
MTPTTPTLLLASLFLSAAAAQGQPNYWDQQQPSYNQQRQRQQQQQLPVPQELAQKYPNAVLEDVLHAYGVQVY